ncbi:hypothetical protein H2199_006407 [Coniosporium tulheliwenetii]|uniref:Uncharacterized protein n=1 Tax=Coniosporium tulheliwenetii TaxID=3383036 RepID=A0ACC2YVF2_9PEZI|nr:hypothetical protein H2199_006407 [Cladosporium sp. JES 115]
MSSFTLPNFSPECKVNLTEDLSKDQLLGFKPINIQSVDFFGGGDKIGFIKLKADVSNDDSEKLPGSVFLRGGSVGMMIILQPDDVPENTETDKHVLLTLQPRVPAGSLSLAELPAGMLSDQGSFAGGAANEIREETGLEVSEDSLINMSELALPPTEDSTAGHISQRWGSDEFIPIFLHQRRVKRDTLKEWQGKLTGLRDHGEKITLKLVRLEELWREGGRDAKALVGWALYEGLRREGKI